MDENQVTSEEQVRADKMRQAQNKAKNLKRAGSAQAVTGKVMRKAGAVADNVGRGVRKGGQSMMKAGAEMSSTGAGIFIGAPLMALGGATAVAGLTAQGAGKVAKGTGRGVEKGGRWAKMKADALEKKNLAKALSDKADGMVSGMAKTATGGLLKSAWTFLIPSWGFTLIWINIHVFLSWVMSGIFCKLGDEWIPKSMKKISGKASAMLRVGEGMLLLTLDSLALLIIGGIIAIIVVVLNVVNNPGIILDSVL